MSAAGRADALAAIAIYAGMFAVGRSGAAAGLDGFDQTALRFAVSGLLVMPFAWRRALASIRRLGVLRLLAIFTLNGAPYSAVFLSALVFAPVAYGAALVPGLQPLTVMAVGALWSAWRPSAPHVVGSMMCLGGIMLMLLDQRAAGEGRLLIGIILFVLSAVMWGTYAVALKAWELEPREVLATAVPLSALLYLPPYLLTRGLEPIVSAPAGTVLLQMAYQGVLVGIAAVVLYAWAIKTAGSAAVAGLAPAMPIMAALIGMFFLGEFPSSLQWAGVAIVSAGLLAGAIWPLLRKPRLA